MNNNPFEKNTSEQGKQDFFDINKIISEQEAAEAPVAQTPASPAAPTPESTPGPKAAAEPAPLEYKKPTPREYTEDTNPQLAAPVEPETPPLEAAAPAASPSAPRVPKYRQLEQPDSQIAQLDTAATDAPPVGDLVVGATPPKNSAGKGILIGVGAFLVVLILGWWWGPQLFGGKPESIDLPTPDNVSVEEEVAEVSGLAVGPGLSLESGKITIAGLSLTGCADGQVVGWDGASFGCVAASASYSTNTNHITQKVYKTEVALTSGGGLAFDGKGKLGLQACGNGQVLKYQGGWVCADDNNSPGLYSKVYSVAAGETILPVNDLPGRRLVSANANVAVSLVGNAITLATAQSSEIQVTVFYQ